MKISPVLLLLFLLSCQGEKPVIKNKKILPVPAATKLQTAVCNYSMNKKCCSQLLVTYNNTRTPANEQRLINYLADSIMPCWYGTKWDFNGTTTIPQTGSIACGYFVTTILQHAGLPVKRIQLAQCASQVIIRKTCTGISVYSNKSLAYFVNEIKQKGTGLYVTGLDFHTGFILNDGKEVYFIHASFYPPGCVVKEKAIESVALNSSKYLMLGRVRF